MRFNRRAVVVTALAALWLGCSKKETPTSPPQPSGPGFVNLQLSTPNTNDGALLFRLSGGVFDSLTSTFTIFTAPDGTNAQRVILAGAIGTGNVARFWVPDIGDLTVYRAVVEQAAVRQTYEQQIVTSYSLSVGQ